MVKKYNLTNQAKIDIDKIIIHINKDNTVSANSVLQAIRSSCALVGRMPKIGRTAEDINSKDLYYLPVEKFHNYLIFYIIVNDIPLIVRVLHAKRDIPTIMKKWYG